MSVQQGTSATYLTRRIARDRPDILERMKQGEYQSVRAAAIEAGIVKVPTRPEVPTGCGAEAELEEIFPPVASLHPWDLRPFD